jgi:hypothetical protein
MASIITANVKAQKLAEYRAARQKGVAWILRHLQPDGALGNPAEGYHFYRAPWTLSLVGETEAAAAVCGWFRRNMLTPDGRIEGPYRVFNDAYAYRNSALIVGAQQAGQYDLSHGLMRDLLSWQDPASGAFPDDLMPSGQKSDNMDIPYACGPGFACLATGHLDAARKVASFLQRIYDSQPALPDRFYYAWSRSKQTIITEYSETNRFWYIVENQVARAQRWTIGGIAAGFLCRLYLAEPDPSYLEYARKYEAFSMAATPRQFEFPQVCKSSWGSSLLYAITGEEPYLEWTYRMGDWFLATQKEDGRWQFKDDSSRGALIELSLEFLMHLDTLMAGLASRP